MTFREGEATKFLENFDVVKTQIRGFNGCEYLELWNDIDDASTFFTYSKWQSAEHLNAYRNSQLFKETWKFTKALFAEKASAWSIKEIRTLG